MSTNTSSADYGRFDELAEEFAARFRRGERPSLQEYIDRCPDLSDEIRELFPALVEVEQPEDDQQEPSGATEPAVPLPPLGQVGDYRVVREVGRGGMGIVYEAEQVSLGRRVALKVLPQHVSQDLTTLARFRREARSAAQLHHTNIVPVFEVGKDGEVSFYAMQFIQGQGLDLVIGELRRLKDRAYPADPDEELERLHQQIPPGSTMAAASRSWQASAMAHSLLTGRFVSVAPSSAEKNSTASATDRGDGDETEAPPTSDLAPAAVSSESSSVVLPGGSQLSAVESGRRTFFRSVAHIGRQVAAGLAYAHARGIVHRDIKPSNLLLDTQGVVWITDFGLAKASDDGLTQTGDILGTVRYMAPERFRGEGDGRVDVYALGLTLYELLTLKPAFDSPDRLKLIEQIKEENPQRPRALEPRIPRDLETIVLKAIAKDPQDRYVSADALGEDLRRFLADEPIRARRVSLPVRLVHWGRRNKAVAGLLIGVVVSLAVGFAVSTTQWVRADRHAAREASLRSEIARDLYTSDMLGVQLAWEVGNVERMGDLLRRHVPEPGQPDWRGFEWDVFWRNYQRARPIRTLAVSDNVWHLSATPNGQTMAALVYVHAPNRADERCEVVVWDGKNGWVPRIFGWAAQSFFSNVIALSPDGRSYATRSKSKAPGQPGRKITVWDAVTGEPLRSGPAKRDAWTCDGALSWSPDGKTLLWGDRDTTLNLWDLQTDEVRTYKGHKAYYRSVEFDPRGRWIASASRDGLVKLWDLQSGLEVAALSHLGDTWDLSFSPDGRYLAAGTSSGARMWDVTRLSDLREVRLGAQRNAMTKRVCFSSDGRYLAAGSSNTVRLWAVESGVALTTLKGHSNLVWGVAFMEGGQILASGSEDRTVKLWNTAEALEKRDVYHAHSGGIASLVFTHDGQTLFSGGSDRLIKKWDAATGRQLAELGPPGVSTPIFSLAVSSDDRTLADSRLGLWDLETGRLFKLGSEDVTSSSAAFSPVESVIAMVHDPGPIGLWDVATKRLLRTLSNPAQHTVNALAFSPNGRLLASAAEDLKVTLWEVDSGLEVAYNLVGHKAGITSIKFGQRGRALASGSRDGRIFIWDIANPARPSFRHSLGGNAGAVWAVAYSADETTIASGHDDGTVKLWDPVAGRERCTLVGHKAKVCALAFSPDGSVLATGDGDGTIRLWRR
jgi:WD40 repeat protein/serine/threonine protein kinase